MQYACSQVVKDTSNILRGDVQAAAIASLKIDWLCIGCFVRLVALTTRRQNETVLGPFLMGSDLMASLEIEGKVDLDLNRFKK